MSAPPDAPTVGMTVAGSYTLAEGLPSPSGQPLWRARRFGASVGRTGTSTATDVLLRLVSCATNGQALQIVDRAAVASGEGHPHVAPLLDCGLERDGRAYLVYDLHGGRTLGAWLALGPFSPAEALDLADQLLAAVESAHFRDTLHCSISADTVYVIRGTAGPVAYLLDLGVAGCAGRSIYDDLGAIAALVRALSDQPLPQPFGAMIDRALAPRATGWSSAAELRAALRAAFA